MAKYVYPAVFELNELDGYCVFFPDLENVFTQGKDLPDAIEMAEDVLCLMLYDMEKKNLPIPQASELGNVRANPGDIVSLITCDTKFYKHYYESKAVKVNVTIPLWLKEEGEKKHVNFSQILQKGIKDYLQLT